jgi:hypothetical protein
MSQADILEVETRLKQVKIELRAKYKYPKQRAKIQQRADRLKRWLTELRCIQ